MTGPRWITEAEYATALTLYRGRPELWTAEGLAELLDLFGIVGAPRILFDLTFTTPGFPLDLVRPHVGRAFVYSFRPEFALPRDRWIALFEQIGYTLNGEAAPAPAEPVTLWRGCDQDFRDNLTWSPDRDVAVVFADRPGRYLYRVDVPPGRLLATMVEGTRGQPQCAARVKGLDKVREVLTDADRELAAEVRQGLDAAYAGATGDEAAHLEASRLVFGRWEK